LKEQVKNLEADRADPGSNSGRLPLGFRGGSTQGMRNRNSKVYQSVDLTKSKQNDDLINFLEHKLEEIEKKLQNTQSEYELLQNEYVDLQDKMNMSREKYKRAALLLTEFLDDILTQTPNILESDKDMHLNLEKIKDTPLERLAKEDKVALVLVLLKQLQPYLSSNNLSTVPPANLQPIQRVMYPP